jgi:hypothetical protein
MTGTESAFPAHSGGDMPIGIEESTTMPRSSAIDREALLAQALALPDVRASDFSGRTPPGDAHPSHLKVIKDTALRSKLIQLRLAEGLQSPKGPQRIASIIRLYPNFNAPVRTARIASPVKGTTKHKGALPTVEQWEALLTRIHAIEGHVAREVGMGINDEIAALQRAVAEVPADALGTALAALGAALAKRKDAGPYIREEAFKRIARDASFPERVHLPYLSKVVKRATP